MDESVVKESKKRKIPEPVYNEDTKRWVKKDGTQMGKTFNLPPFVREKVVRK